MLGRLRGVVPYTRAGQEPVKSLQVKVSRQNNTGDAVIGASGSNQAALGSKYMRAPSGNWKKFHVYRPCSHRELKASWHLLEGQQSRTQSREFLECSGNNDLMMEKRTARPDTYKL